MKSYKDMKVVIIGLGNLAEYMVPCWKNLLGENLTRNILAVKATERNLEEKRAKFGFPIQVGGAGEALKKMEPDVIFLSPPPRQVPGVAAEILKPYYDELRAAGKALPILLNYAPDPKPNFFYDLLGEGIHIVNILPAMMSNVSGIDTARCSYNFVTFEDSHPWPQEERQWLEAFLAPVGEFRVVPASIVSPVLAAKVMSRPVLDLCFMIHEIALHRGIEIPIQSVASAMRYQFRSMIPDMTPDPDRCSAGDVPKAFLPLIDRTIRHWFMGVADFCRSVGVPDDTIYTCCRFKIEMQLLSAQYQSKEALLALTSRHATPGGVTECSNNLFEANCRSLFAQAVNDYLDGKLDEGFWQQWQKIAAGNNEAIAIHAARLSK